jgi:hypothetical protein
MVYGLVSGGGVHHRPTIVTDTHPKKLGNAFSITVSAPKGILWLP